MSRMPCFLAAIFAICFLATSAWADDASNLASPHAEAIQLVMRTQQKQIRNLDDPGNWWLDTKDRTWSARRTVGPGVLDTTHFFLVRYSVDGVIMGEWVVDTRQGGVTANLPRPE